MNTSIKMLVSVVVLSVSLSALADGARKIVKLTPEDGATNVPLTTTEISIEFDKEMAPTSLLLGDCEYEWGVCNIQGVWKSKTLFVVPNVKLKPGRTYSLSLGDPYSKTQRFGADGVAMPITPWTFTTAGQ